MQRTKVSSCGTTRRGVFGESLNPHSHQNKVYHKFHRYISFTESTITISNTNGNSKTFKVPYMELLDSPNGMIPDAFDACTKHIPVFDGFSDLLTTKLQDAPSSILDQIHFITNIYSRHPSYNPDNPGHILLVIRGVCGNDVSYLYTAYIYALAKSICMETPFDIEKLIFIHAGICKAIGSAYYAIPIKKPNAPYYDHISILAELIFTASIDVMGPGVMSLEERLLHLQTLRRWHAPKYARDFKNEGLLWSLSRPCERAAAINNGLGKIY